MGRSGAADRSERRRARSKRSVAGMRGRRLPCARLRPNFSPLPPRGSGRSGAFSRKNPRAVRAPRATLRERGAADEEPPRTFTRRSLHGQPRPRSGPTRSRLGDARPPPCPGSARVPPRPGSARAPPCPDSSRPPLSSGRDPFDRAATVMALRAGGQSNWEPSAAGYVTWGPRTWAKLVRRWVAARVRLMMWLIRAPRAVSTSETRKR